VTKLYLIVDLRARHVVVGRLKIKTA